MTRLLVNDQEVEGVAGQPIACSKQAAEIGDLTTRKVNFTRTFFAPFTPANDLVLRNVRNPNSLTGFPYTLQRVKLIEDGFELISEGKVIVSRAAGRYELYIISGAIGFFDAIKGKKLTDLGVTDDLIDSWQEADVKNYRAATSGVVSPIMSYGKFVTSPQAIHTDTYLPSIFYKTVLDKIIEEAGYQKSGAVFDLPRLEKRILPFGRAAFEYDSTFAERRSASAVSESAQNMGSVTFEEKVTFTRTTKQDDFGYWDLANSEYAVNIAGLAANKAVFGVKISYVLDITVTGGGTVNINVNGANGGPFQTGLTTGVHTFSTQEYFEGLAPSPELADTMAAWNAPTGFNFDIYLSISNASGTTSVVVNSAKLIIDVSNKPLTGTDTVVFFYKLLPDMTQADFIKDFAMTFGVLFDESLGVLYAKPYNEIITNIGEASDWTNKRIAGTEEVEFTPLGYAQENTFLYTERDDLIGQVGRGVFNIANVTAPESRNIYTSPFANSYTRVLGEILMAVVPVFDSSTSYYIFDKDPGMRVLLVRDKYSYEPDVRFEGVTDYNDYQVAYFEDPDQDLSMSWQQSIDDYYSYLVVALQKAKVVTRRYNLRARDFLKVNFLAPIFDTNSFFLVNNIQDRISGRPTAVELFKL